MSKNDPIASLLDSETEAVVGSTGMVERVFGDRPAVLESIQAAVRRGIPKTVIARKLTEGLRAEGSQVTITSGQLGRWLAKNPT